MWHIAPIRWSGRPFDKLRTGWIRTAVAKPATPAPKAGVLYGELVERMSLRGIVHISCPLATSLAGESVPDNGSRSKKKL